MCWALPLERSEPRIGVSQDLIDTSDGCGEVCQIGTDPSYSSPWGLRLTWRSASEIPEHCVLRVVQWVRFMVSVSGSLIILSWAVWRDAENGSEGHRLQCVCCALTRMPCPDLGRRERTEES